MVNWPDIGVAFKEEISCSLLRIGIGISDTDSDVHPRIGDFVDCGPPFGSINVRNVKFLTYQHYYVLN